MHDRPAGRHSPLVDVETYVSQNHFIDVGILLVLLSGLDAILLQQLQTKAKATLDLLDDRIFVSKISIALYTLSR